MAHDRQRKLTMIGLYGLTMLNFVGAGYLAQYSFLLGASIVCAGLFIGTMLFDLNAPAPSFLRKPAYTCALIWALEICVAAALVIMNWNPVPQLWAAATAMTLAMFDAAIVVGAILWVTKLGFARAPAELAAR